MSQDSNAPGRDDNTPGAGNPSLAPATRLVQAGRRKGWTGMADGPGAIVNPPVYRASTILFDDVAHMRAAEADNHQKLYYGRRGTPTSWSLAEAITQMEPEAAGTMLFPSGVAAIATALLAVLRPGDELLMVDSAYGPSRAICDGLLREFDVTTVYYDPLICAGIADLFSARTRALFMESPGSLTFEVQDVPALVAAARARGIVTLIDNSWATPLLLPALGLGVDIAILAGTKYLVGHSDAMLGSVSANAALWPAIQRRAFGLGQMAGPDDAWLAARGLRTLDLRLRHQGNSALTIARWLAGRDEIRRVLHPALPSCPGHEAFRRDFAGPAGLFAFEFDGGSGSGGDAARVAFVDALVHFGIGFSWGGYESLALPVDPAPMRTAVRWRDRGPLVRLNIGLEDPADLIADLDQALEKWRARAQD
jgi:cysteine-S-conjugate beta-lyase